MIHFIGGEKGGVGKSVISRLLAQYFIDNQIPFKGYDTDRSHNTFLRFYEDFASPTTVDSYEHLDAMIENYDMENPNRIIVDLAAQTTTQSISGQSRIYNRIQSGKRNSV